MSPLPRVLAYTDDRVAAMEDFGIHAAAIAAAGPEAALVARCPGGTADALTTLAARCVSLARPAQAPVLVSARADVALAVGAQGVVLRRQDLPANEVRRLAPDAAIFRSVHSTEEAREAVKEGADAVIVGTIWTSASHPGQSPAGLDLLRSVAALGLPTYAIGGVTTSRAAEAREAGAWGVAAIGTLWDARDSYRETLALLAPWREHA